MPAEPSLVVPGDVHPAARRHLGRGRRDDREHVLDADAGGHAWAWPP